MDIEIRHLRLMQAVVASGSLTKAGRELHLSQSALSHQLRDIESRLGTALFLRVGKRLVVTAAGAHLQRSAADVLQALETTERQIQRIAGGRRGVLRISSGRYTGYHWLPPVLKAYRETYPSVDVQVASGATGDPMTLLLDGRLEVAIVAGVPAHERVAARPLFDDDMVVIVEPRHALAARRFVQPEDFAGETLFLTAAREECPFYQSVLLPAGVKPASVQIVSQSGAIVELVKAGLGLAVLPRWEVTPDVKAGALRALPLTRAGERRRWSAVVLKDMAGVAYLHEFIELLARSTSAPARVVSRRA